MTDLRQAAQQALDAWDDPAGMKDLCVAMDALRTALAMHQVSEFAQQQQQAEPVAYFDFQELKFSWAKHMKIGPVPVSIKVEPMKLYTTPPQRQWVGLTDEDVNRESAMIAQKMKLAFHAGMYVAQEILKEKNSD